MTDRKVLVETEDFRVSLEMWENFPMLHLGVFKFSRAVYRQMQVCWPTILEQLQQAGFTQVYATPFVRDARAKRFIEHFGFKLIKTSGELHLMRRSTKGELYA